MDNSNKARGLLLLKAAFYTAAAFSAIAATVFLSKGFLGRFTSDGSVDHNFYHIWLLKTSFFHAAAFFIFCAVFICRKTGGGDSPAEPGPARAVAIKLFAVSFLILFTELSLIRWVPAYLKLMSYFTNFILLASFLGMGLGCLAAGRATRLMKYFPALTALLVIATALLHPLNSLNILAYQTAHFSGSEIFFGSGQQLLPSRFVNTGMVVAVSLIYILTTLIFTGPGQLMGEMFNAIENPIRAYSINIAASVAGIVVFSIMAMLCAPAWSWFVAIACIALALLKRQKSAGIPGAALFFGIAISLTVILNFPWNGKIIWSPYYKIAYLKPLVNINEIGHQIMVDYNEGARSPYNLANLIARDSQGRKFDEVLIIGAGSGNDVAHQLKYGAKHIDAVDIEPVIIGIGKKDHPNKPYSDPRVRIINDDGRSFLRSTNKKYDLIIYGAVDSITLMSGFSSVRLESYLFTTDAFKDVKRHLKPGGVFVINNFLRQSWLSVRIYRMLEEVFGQEPVFTLIPNKTTVSVNDGSSEAISFYMAGDISKIKRSFSGNGNNYHMETTTPWLREPGPGGSLYNGFRPPPAADAGKGQRFTDVKVDGGKGDPLPDDNWPFVYLRKPGIPAHNVWGLLLIAALSLGLIAAFSGKSGAGKISPHFFFLGGAFMLLETESVTKLALIHGSTWFVNSLVFTAVLTMIFIANIYMLKRPLKSAAPAFIALLASLALNYFVGVEFFLGKSWFVENVASSAVVFLPIAFAGLIFASSFSKSRRPAFDLSSNLLGIISGGIAEYASLSYGYNFLLILVAGMYIAAIAFIPRRGA